jgi:phosphoglucomutase
VEKIKDFKAQTCRIVSKNETKTMNDIPKSNVLIYYTLDGTKVCVRPSGTEPKIKFYVSVKDKINSNQDFEEKLITLNQKIENVKKDFGDLDKSNAGS